MAAAYTMSSLVQFEPFVDSATEEFLRQLEDRFEHDICNFGKWLQFYAFDVIGELAFSQRLGFIEEGQDIGGIMGTMGKYGIYVTVVSQSFTSEQLLTCKGGTNSPTRQVAHEKSHSGVAWTNRSYEANQSHRQVLSRLYEGESWW